MVPDLECTVALQLTYNSVRSRDTVMRGLEDAGDLIGNWNRENKEVWKN